MLSSMFLLPLFQSENGMETELTIADSIAIKILQGGSILTGVGNELHLQESKTTKRAVLSQRLRAKVHGIVDAPIRIACSDQGRLIVHGEKECMILQYEHAKNKYTFRELYHFHLTDWISSASFLQDPNEFIIVTSHSSVLKILYDEKEKRNLCRVTAKSSSKDKSTLYCSHIHGRTMEEIVIFGGNAFGELLIWKPFLGDSISNDMDCDEYHVELSRRQPAHNGVIFSIDFDYVFGLLTTTSDDRSIRFWKLEKNSSDYAKFDLSAIASGYGHVARVFRGKLFHYGGQPYAATVAEDSYVCVWKSNAELMFKKRVQFGAVIWNFEYEDCAHALYTVGSTGNLMVYSLEDVLNRKSNISSTATELAKWEPKEYVTKAKFVKSNMVVGVTNKSRLMYASVKCNKENQEYEFEPWVVVEMQMPFKCTVLEVHGNYLAICGYKRLTLYKYEEGAFKKLFDEDILDGIIRAFHYLQNCSFLVTDESGKSLFLEGESLKDRIVVPLPHCKEPWSTTALRIQTHKKKEFLVISNRMGNLLLFNLDIAAVTCSHLSTLRQPHGALGATMLRIQEVCDDAIFIQSAGHDGSVRSLSIDIKTDTIRSHQRTLVPVRWVESLIANENFEFLLGFNDNHFVVWSERYDFSVKVPCGGGHRCWHYNICSDIDSATFLQLLFIKNKELKLHRHKLFNVPAENEFLRNQWHTRSCNALKLIASSNPDVPYTILISAGDDNMVKVSKLMSKGHLEQCAEVHSHISNVRALQVLQVNQDHVLIFSGGGRAQLCVTQLNLKSFRMEDLVNYTLNRSGKNNEELGNCYRTDPETRIMACDIVEANTSNSGMDTGYLIFLCCSDGYLRKLLVDASFQVASESGFYYGCCLLQVRAFANSFLITAGTDGNLRFFDLELIELPIHLSHHASGVNAMDILFEHDIRVLHVLTGGDDQSVSYTSLQLHGAKTFRIENKYLFLNAHSAQVTAVQLFSDGKTICAYTSGLDQIINIVKIHDQHYELICYTCISDVKGLVVDKSKRCFVYGSGIQIFKLKK